MIVSELEIHKVIDLLIRPTPQPRLRTLADGAPCADAETIGPLQRICVEEGRDGRLDSLRYLLSRGKYDVAPSMVADKIVGRAICDQVARLYDV